MFYTRESTTTQYKDFIKKKPCDKVHSKKIFIWKHHIANVFSKIEKDVLWRWKYILYSWIHFQQVQSC